VRTAGPIRALELAVEGEKAGLKQYLEYAWLTRNENGRGMFVRLALDEFGHMDLLERQLSSLAASGCWRPEPVPRSAIEDIVPRLAGRGPEVEGTRGLTQLSALQTALDLENRARDFYRAQADAAGEPAAREMFARLGDMEQSHADLVQAEIDSINRTGFWLSVPEFTLEAPDR